MNCDTSGCLFLSVQEKNAKVRQLLEVERMKYIFKNSAGHIIMTVLMEYVIFILTQNPCDSQSSFFL